MEKTEKTEKMQEKKIRKYAALMTELGLTGLEVSENGCMLRLERNLTGSVSLSQEPVLPVVPISNSGDEHDIFSPLVGVFYAAPAEDARPFVQVGDAVKKGDVICIIEAMKLMNEITAEEDGVISEICVTNNQVVDYGQRLFRFKKE
mgnify:FL=1